MENSADMLEAMMAKTATVMASIESGDHANQTPCDEFTVVELLEHIAVWVQVFDGAVNDTTPDFDPNDHRISSGWTEILTASASSIVAGLRERGSDREMTMTEAPMPGAFIVNMMLMEYVGHGWDLSHAVGRVAPYTDAEAEAALAAATAIIAPQYRGTGMFGEIVDIAEDAAPIDRFVAFLGRDPKN